MSVKQTEVHLSIEEGDEAKLTVRGLQVVVREGQPITVPLAHQGARDPGAPTTALVEGGRRADGTVITSSIPTIAHITE